MVASAFDGQRKRNKDEANVQNVSDQTDGGWAGDAPCLSVHRTFPPRRRRDVVRGSSQKRGLIQDSTSSGRCHDDQLYLPSQIQVCYRFNS